MKNPIYLFIIGLTLVLVQCKKKDSEPLPVLVQMELKHTIGDENLEMDKIQYVNAAGNEFSVKRLLYYVSGFVFEDEKGVHHEIAGAQYVDINDAATLRFDIGLLPPGKYSKLEFSVGLAPDLNVFGNLPNTVENSAMFWPEHMGGGYHFMKLEGHYMTSASEIAGYAMHIGTNKTLVNIAFNQSYNIDSDHNHLILKMNIQEWFQNPTTYDLNGGNYSMGDANLMEQITKNGTDVFTFIP